jgi:hypothetical protein
MKKYKIFLAAMLTFFLGNHATRASLSDSTTNEPARITIGQLLQNKGKWDSKRVEVIGFYVSFFEYSALADADRAATENKIWVNLFFIAPGCKEKIAPVQRGWVKIIGRFESRNGGNYGHLGGWPAQITQLELVERVPTQSLSNSVPRSPQQKETNRVNNLPRQ